MIISHDRWFLDRVATHILAFEGNSHVEWFEGNYQAYEQDKKLRLEYLNLYDKYMVKKEGVECWFIWPIFNRKEKCSIPIIQTIKM